MLKHFVRTFQNTLSAKDNEITVRTFCQTLLGRILICDEELHVLRTSGSALKQHSILFWHFVIQIAVVLTLISVYKWICLVAATDALVLICDGHKVKWAVACLQAQ